jgi:hypothetical protein
MSSDEDERRAARQRLRAKFGPDAIDANGNPSIKVFREHRRVLRERRQEQIAAEAKEQKKYDKNARERVRGKLGPDAIDAKGKLTAEGRRELWELLITETCKSSQSGKNGSATLLACLPEELSLEEASKLISEYKEWNWGEFPPEPASYYDLRRIKRMKDLIEQEKPSRWHYINDTPSRVIAKIKKFFSAEG